MYNNDWMDDVSERFKSGYFVLSRHNTNTRHRGDIHSIKVRRLTLRGRRVVFKLMATEFRNFLGKVVPLRNPKNTFTYDTRSMIYTDHTDGVLEIRSETQQLLLFPAGYYQPDEWDSWLTMVPPPSALNR